MSKKMKPDKDILLAIFNTSKGRPIFKLYLDKNYHNKNPYEGRAVINLLPGDTYIYDDKRIDKNVDKELHHHEIDIQFRGYHDLDCKICKKKGWAT